MAMVAAVVFMLRKRASLATGEAMAPQASSLTVHTRRLKIGTAMKPQRSPRAPIASPEASHSRPPEFPGVFLGRLSSFTEYSLLGRRFEVPLLQDLLPLAAGYEVDPLIREGRLLSILEGGDRVGRDDIKVGRDRHDLHLVPYIRGVVARVAESGVGVSDDYPVYGGSYIALPGDHVGEDSLLEARTILPVRLAQDLHGVVGSRNILGGEH